MREVAIKLASMLEREETRRKFSKISPFACFRVCFLLFHKSVVADLFKVGDSEMEFKSRRDTLETFKVHLEACKSTRG
jgi:hypothetical protein